MFRRRVDWTIGALERYLSGLGVKTIGEALMKVKKEIKEKGKDKESTNDVIEMDEIFRKVQNFIGNDYEMIPLEIREEISKMPVKNIDDFRKWGNALFQAIKKARSCAPEQIPSKTD